MMTSDTNESSMPPRHRVVITVEWDPSPSIRSAYSAQTVIERACDHLMDLLQALEVVDPTVEMTTG